uniref:Kinesin-like protein n=1 Tax=Romanomermis culicivorax TaxID=13658 RepID=A0A915JGB5_ROMCU
MCAEPLIEKLFEGYNCTIFAYGQTGSGKTFTMGTECCDFTIDSDRKGMIPRIVEAIFARADSDDESEIIVKCSMLEIYEERVLDLLSDKSEKPELFIREHPQEGIFVQNLCQVQVGDSHQTMQQLAQGCLSRTKGGTAMNSESSRSHAIFTIFVKKLMKSDSGTRFCYSKLHLVDLAGSERLKKTQAQGERKKEGIKINEGLLALGNVISALTDSTQQRSHIPYRDSKLTRLLQDSLGGNTYTVMITCVSPADSNYDETLNSLRYAERAKKIKNKPTVNEDPNAREICDLRKK